MPSFLKKIFRRGPKKGRFDEEGNETKKLTKKQLKALAKQKKEETLNLTTNVPVSSPRSDPNGVPSEQRRTTLSSPSSSVYKKRQVGPASHTLVDLDDSSFDDTSVENRDPRPQTLDARRLREHQRACPPAPEDAASRALQLTRTENGRLTLVRAKEGGDGERAESPTSTDFCLSTDVDDESYNELRRRGLPGLTSEDALFPGFPDSDDMRAWTPSPERADGGFSFKYDGNEDDKGFGNFSNADFPSDPFLPSSSSPPTEGRVGPTTTTTEEFFVQETRNNPFKKKDMFPDSSDSEFETASEKRLAGENVLMTTDSGSVTDRSKSSKSPSHFENLLPKYESTATVPPPKKSPTESPSPSPSSRPSTPSSVVRPTTPQDTKPRLVVSVETSVPSSPSEQDRTRKHAGSSSSRRPSRRRASNRRRDDDADDSSDSAEWMLDEMRGTLGPAAANADLESLGERSRRSRTSHASRRSHRSHGSRRHRRQRSSDSQGSRTSHRSALSHMSDASRSVAKDLLRLEMQLAAVDGGSVPRRTRDASSVASSSRSYGSSVPRVRRARVTVVAPPGKLGIILANKSDVLRGTVVSGVRSSSVLVDRIFPGDRIVAVDGEDVSRMTVSEITTIMARKTEFERTLTVMTTPASGPRSETSSALSDHGSYR